MLAPNTLIQGGIANTEVVNIENGNLYFSTTKGTGGSAPGIYAFTGLPTTAAAATAVIVGVIGQGTSPYDFAISPDGLSAYVADGTDGVQKFTKSGSTWSLAYNFTATGEGLTGLAVNFGATNSVYAVSPTALWSVADSGAGGAMTSIATAGTDYAFRGLEFAPTPVPEPSSVTLMVVLGIAGLFGFAWRRRRSAR